MFQTAPVEKRGMHYGWMVVLGAFLSQIILLICLQGLPLALPSIEQSLKIAHAAAGTIVSVFGLCYAGFSFFWGFLSDKIGVRKTVTIAGLIAGIMLILFGLAANTLTKAIVIYALVGFGCAGIYSATMPKLIGEWFAPSKRGRAMSLITPGGVLTGAALGIVAPKLIAAHGWQKSFWILGIVAVVVLLIMTAIIRNKPEEMGLRPVGAEEDFPVSAAPTQSGRQAGNENKFAEVLKLKITWHLGITYIFWQLAYMACMAFLVVSIKAAGFSLAVAGMAVTVFNLFQLVGQQIWGPLSDRWERKVVIAIANIWFVISALIYAGTYGKGGAALAYCMVALIGIAFGVVPVLLATFSDYFAPEIRGTGNGIISTLAAIGRLGGPIIAGLLADRSHTLTSAFVFAAAMMLISAVLALTLPRLRTN